MNETLHKKLEKELESLIISGEEILIKIKGQSKEALVCTPNRVIILKTGFTNGSTFGVNIFQVPYENITSVEVKTGLLTGYLEVSAGGVQNRSFAFNAQAGQKPNCIVFSSTSKKEKAKFNEAARFILSLKNKNNEADNVRQEITLQTTSTSDPSQDDIFIALEKLGALRDNNIITEEEFNTKKVELLSRL